MQHQKPHPAKVGFLRLRPPEKRPQTNGNTGLTPLAIRSACSLKRSERQAAAYSSTQCDEH